MSSWRTLARKTILNHSKWLTVQDHTVELPNGRVIEHWPWVTTPDYINAVVINEEGEFLLFRQTKYAIQGTSLAPIGGYIEPNEDPLIAAKRELLEEMGCVAKEWISLGNYRVDANRGAGIGHLFLARGAERIQEPDADDLEEQELVRMNRTQVEAAMRDGEFKVLAWVANIALALNYRNENQVSPMDGVRDYQSK
jgi:ADP-ribose pyrophosphatase